MSVDTLAPWMSYKARVGEADGKVLDEEPAAMLPAEDQMISLPPRRVKIREMPKLTLVWVNTEMFPPSSVMIPGGADGLPKTVLARVTPPPGAKRLMFPPGLMFPAVLLRMLRQRV